MSEETSLTSPEGLSEPRSTSRRLYTLVPVLLLIAGLTGLFAFGLSRDPTLIRSALIGRPAPGFALQTLDGDRTVRLSDLRGQVVVVNFWASWCAACREEHPNFIAAWTRYQDQGVVILGVMFQDSPSAARDFMKQEGGDWPILVDPGERTALAYGVYGVPETFFIGKNGTVAYKQVGYSSYDVLTQHIEALLSQPARSG